MRTLLNITILAALLSLTSSAQAETELQVSGQVRVRSNIDKKSFDPDVNTADLHELRTRVAVTAVVDSNTQAYVQLQDSRILGGDDLSGTLTSGKNVDVHQAYITIKELWKNGVGVKAGRFEVNLGNQRVFGSVGWHNVGRSWEGFNPWFERPCVRIDGYWLKRRENYRGGDHYIYGTDILGTNIHLKKQGLELYYFMEAEERTFAYVYPSGVPDKKFFRHNLGLYGSQQMDRFDFTYNAVYQFGVDKDPAGDIDISAYLLTLETGYTLNPDIKARIAAGVDYASGDDDLWDREINYFSDPYYTGHKFRGYMDYFTNGDNDGLVDLMLRGQIAPISGWQFNLDIHHFRSVYHRNYILGDSRYYANRNLGTEFDVVAQTARIKGVILELGAAAFLATKDFAGRDNDPGLWAYSMLTVDF